jgi:predicted nucleic acid-binding protein
MQRNTSPRNVPLGIEADIGNRRTGIDTAIFIYFIEEHPSFIHLIEPLFVEADSGVRELVTSALTLLEVLVIPYRLGDRSLAERYEQLLTRSRGIRLFDLSRDQLRDAAQLRATTGVKTPDALQLAAAIGSGCTAFVTNDRRMPNIPSMRVLQLADYTSA